MDRGSVEDAGILQKAVRVERQVRRAYSIEPDAVLISRVEERFDACRPEIEAFFGIALGGREGAGFIRYPEGGYYKPHRDRTRDRSWPAAARRAIALVVFLNGNFEGGLLRIYAAGTAVDVTPQHGLLVAFPADLLHEVTEVRNNSRDVVVDWFYGAGAA